MFEIHRRTTTDYRTIKCGRISPKDVIKIGMDEYMMQNFGAKRTSCNCNGGVNYKNYETGERYQIW